MANDILNKSIMFIYSKNDKIKALSLENSLKLKEELIKDNWKHTATINAIRFVEHICNEVPKEELYKTINSLKKR